MRDKAFSPDPAFQVHVKPYPFQQPWSLKIQGLSFLFSNLIFLNLFTVNTSKLGQASGSTNSGTSNGKGHTRNGKHS